MVTTGAQIHKCNNIWQNLHLKEAKTVNHN